MDACGMTGTYYHNIDTKGRMNFPVKLREVLGESFWVVRGTGGDYLSVYSNERWEGIKAQIVGVAGPQAEQLKRWLFSGASEVSADKQGRILVPQALREFARLEKDVVVIGAGNKAEIWDREKWEETNASFDPTTLAALDNLCL